MPPRVDPLVHAPARAPRRRLSCTGAKWPATVVIACAFAPAAGCGMGEDGHDRAGVRCLLVLNPHSRNGGSQRDALRDAVLGQGCELIGDTVDSEPAALAERLHAHGAGLRPGSDRILVAGGDGTVQRLLPALVDAPLPVGLVPLGTANDLARTLGLPDDIDGAVAVACRGRPVRIDVGRINDCLFANVASLGLGPQVTRRLSARLKQRIGILGYPKALLGAYRDTKPFRCRVKVDGGEPVTLRTVHVAIGNGRHYGGGATVDECASIDDGMLDLYALSPMPLWRFILRGPWLKYGRHRRVDGVRTLHGRRMVVDTSRRLRISADGELVGHTPATVEVLPGALRVMVPRAGDADGLSRARTVSA
jgi:YegS/Rv2252/BmrU family lipid kinase